MKNTPKKRARVVWRLLFGAAACWTAIGAVPALVHTAETFGRFHGVEADSALLLEVYRGAWGQSLLFAVGYLLAAFAPVRYAAIILLGAVGKAAYAAGLLGKLIAGGGGPVAPIAVVGDLVFAVVFAVFLVSSGVLPGLLEERPRS